MRGGSCCRPPPSDSSEPVMCTASAAVRPQSLRMQSGMSSALILCCSAVSLANIAVDVIPARRCWLRHLISAAESQPFAGARLKTQSRCIIMKPLTRHEGAARLHPLRAPVAVAALHPAAAHSHRQRSPAGMRSLPERCPGLICPVIRDECRRETAVGFNVHGSSSALTAPGASASAINDESS